MQLLKTSPVNDWEVARLIHKQIDHNAMKLISNNPTPYSEGFTIIELLVSIAILVGISGLGLFVSIDFYKSYILNSERDIVVSILQSARNYSITNINESKHGVYFNPTEYVIFQGNSYATRTIIYDENIKVNPGITHTGLQEIIFQQLTGEPAITGDIVLNNSVRSLIISVQNEGRIN